MLRFLCLTIFFLVFANSAHAIQVKPVVIFNAEFGGDTLVDFTYDDGSKADIEAGRGIVIGGGTETHFNDMIMLHVLGSWKFTTIPQASNGDATWTRIPIDLIVYYKQDKLFFGGGVTYNLNNKLEGTGAVASIATDFDNALGYIVSGGYHLTEKFALTGRYNVISYTPTGTSFSANGNNISMGVNLYFK